MKGIQNRWAYFKGWRPRRDREETEKDCGEIEEIEEIEERSLGNCGTGISIQNFREFF